MKVEREEEGEGGEREEEGERGERKRDCRLQKIIYGKGLRGLACNFLHKGGDLNRTANAAQNMTYWRQMGIMKMVFLNHFFNIMSLPGTM
jgi:hypothetical protein